MVPSTQDSSGRPPADQPSVLVRASIDPRASLIPGTSAAAAAAPAANSRSERSDPSDLPATPAQAAKDAKTGPELLRRLSLRGTPPVLEAHPREQYPSLNLSGRIISAAFCIPYKVHLRNGQDWVRDLLSTPLLLRPRARRLKTANLYLRNSKLVPGHRPFSIRLRTSAPTRHGGPIRSLAGLAKLSRSTIPHHL